MEKVNGRRGFLKGFGLGGVIASGVAAGYVTSKVINQPAALPAPVEPKKDISHLAPVDKAGMHGHLQIMKNNEPDPLPRDVNGMGYTLTIPSYDMTNANKVELTVGRDNHLWMRTPDGWKRFVVEG